MVRISNTILAIVNMITLLAGLAAVGAGLYFVAAPNRGVTACEKIIQTPLLLAGAVLFGVSFLGLVGSCCRANFVLYMYLTVVFLLIVGLIGFTVFAFVVTNKSIGNVFAKTKVTDFKGRLWDQRLGGKNWEEIRSCLVYSNLCKTVGVDFYQKNFSPLQSGCCKPPTSCGFKPQNATFWVVPNTGPTSKNTDCETWSNQQDTLCYNCESCQAGFVTNVKDQWKIITIVNACAIIVCIFVYTIGCCAKTNNRKDSSFNRFRGYNQYYHP